MPGKYQCPGCGKRAPKRTEIIFRPSQTVGQLSLAQLVNPPQREPWTYTGNQRVLKEGRYSGELHYVIVWDGISYQHKYHPFCGLRCALGYARSAYKSANPKGI